MHNHKALQNLLNGTATEEEINLLKVGLGSGEISIGGNVNHSVIIIGNGNTVEIPPAVLDKLGGRSLLGDLDRDLTGDEIASGLNRLEAELPLRAPILLTQFKEQTHHLRSSLKTNFKSLSDQARRERVEALAQINGLCMEVLDISFNALCLGENLPEYDSRSPFRGLESFRPEDSEFFFGREALTKKLVDKINSHPFLAVLGASGSGKSSLVMAGLIPALDSDYVIFRPGTNPLEALRVDKENALVVVDQFEELFTLTSDVATRKEFINRLLELLKTNRVVVTMRADFWGEIAVYKDLKQIMQDHQELIAPMDKDELRRAMEGQARQVGLRFEADLSQQILDDVEGEPGAMPLLQHALWELWNRRHGRNLRASEYRAFGGVKKAITSTAEKIYEDCNKDEQEQMRDIFLRLTRLDENDEGRDTRRRVEINNLIPSGRDTTSIALLIEKLANERLIVKTVHDDKTEIEVAHEALIRHWGRLRNWLGEDREHLKLREGVSEDARKWERSEKKETFLNHRGGRLDDALSLEENSRYGLTDIEQTYLKSCVSLRNKEQREREQRLRWTVIASITAAMIFLVLGSFGLVKSKEATARADEAATAQVKAETNANTAATAQIKAEELANIAFARQLAAQAHLLNLDRSSKQVIASLIAIQAMKLSPTLESARFLIENNHAAFSISQMLHDDNVTSVAFSPDGKYAVSGSDDNTVRVWETITGREVARMNHSGDVVAIAFSPDGKYVLSGSHDNTARIWDATTGKEITRMTHGGKVEAIAFSPDSRYAVSGGDDNTARMWEVATGKEITRMTHENTIWSIALSPDGKYVATGSGDYTICVWEAFTGNESKCMTHDNYINSVAFSPDSKYVVSGSEDNTARVWKADTGEEVARMTHDGSVNSIAFSPDGRYVTSGSYDHTARVWEVATGNEISRMTHDYSVKAVAFSPDGKYVVSGGNDDTARVWEAVSGEEVARMTHGGGVNSIVFSPDGRYVASGSYDNTARLWEISNENGGARMSHNSWVRSVVFSPDGKYLVSGGGDNTVRVWDTSTGNEITRMYHGDGVYAVAFSPDGKYVVSGSRDETVRIWEVFTGKEVKHMTHDSIVESVAFSPDGKYVVSGSDDYTARVWEVATGNEIARMVHDGGVNSIAFSPNGKYVISGSNDDTARVWEAATGNEISRMTHNNSVETVAFSPDSKYVVSGSADHTACVWKTSTGEQIACMIHDDSVYIVAFSSDGRYVISGSSDNTARVWEASTSEEISRMTHDNWVFAVAFSPDGKYVASASHDGTARVWEAFTGKEFASTTFDDEVLSIAFSPNGRYVASGSYDHTIRIWEYLPEDLIATACSLTPRNLTKVEWGQYIGDTLPYQIVCPNLPPDLMAIAQNAILNSEDSKRVKKAFDDVKAEAIKSGMFDDPDYEAFRFVGAVTRNQFSDMADSVVDTEEELKKVIDLLEQAEQIHIPIYDIGALNNICWFGSLQGDAGQVLQYCELALQISPNEGFIRDSRGLARALTGDYQGAISDFQYFVDEEIKNGNGQDNDVKNRQLWIIDLKAGRNPFTAEILEALKNE